MWSASLMDFKQINLTQEGMPLNSDDYRITPEASTTEDSGATMQPTQVTINNFISPPLHYNVNLPSDNPAVTAINDRGPPPSYEEAVDPNASPPSYESLFGLVGAHKLQKGIFNFLQNILVLLLGTIGCTILLGVTYAIPICMMIIGGIYLYDCPQGEYIPIYLLVGGAFGVFQQLLHLSGRVRKRRGELNQELEVELEEERIRQSSTQTLINCFMLGWFIIGSIWVYKEYEPNYDPAFGKYCNKTLYLFAFWLITLTYILLALIIVSVCGISSYKIYCYKKNLST